MCKVCVQIDQTKADAFAGQLLTIMNQGALTLMMSVGHRTGLFDHMAQMPPATSEAIADSAGLNERYVREWLDTMVTGDIVEYTPGEGLYHLPAEHAAFLTRAAGADNIAIFAQYIPVLANVEDRIIECFREGGGVAYEEYERFHEVMAEDSGQSVLHTLIDSILPLAPEIIDKLNNGIDVLDVGCGRGKALITMAGHFPNSRFYGYDLCIEPIEEARREVAKQGLTNIQFEQKDLTHHRFEIQFDFITAFDAIHDQARPDHVLSAVNRALKPGGTFLMQDIDASSEVQNNRSHPLGSLIYTISCMHCMTVSLAQDGLGLGAMWGTEKAVEMLRKAGFDDPEIKRLDHDVQNCYYILKK
jgi:2-polyprenyl-3-methyl-5-hydroxy-6-metoxy-1,4-benzoquinol methylase